MDVSSVIRTILLIVALVNQVLVSTGKSPLPFEDEQLETVLSTVFTTVISLWTWWKNNYISKKGQEQKRVLEANDLYKK